MYYSYDDYHYVYCPATLEMQDHLYQYSGICSEKNINKQTKTFFKRLVTHHIYHFTTFTHKGHSLGVQINS